MLDALLEAKAKMTASLDILDKVGSPAHIGAHLQMAICKLDDEIGKLLSQIGVPLMETAPK
jgi:hypothetical protein